mmetsp:Transcript_28777/g.37158  ORF Transcript_28777/g.37158 Transcript_28777/m.37158 type:complete len:2600 (+) Transcript_28777:19-7818(+)
MGARLCQALVFALFFLQDGVLSTRGNPTLPIESLPDLSLSETKEIVSGSGINMVQIEPSILSFKNSPTCIPTVSLIDILNIHENEELHILGISSDNSQFHPAMFKPQVLPPDGRATIQIIYLPRNVGSEINGKLTISTSFGDIIYLIEATAITNPYRLHPFIGTKIPAGVVYSRPIIMYNPTDEPLHVREVFTTESFLTLHLPDDLISPPSSSNYAVDGIDDGLGDEGDEGLFQHPQATLSSPTSSEGLWVIPPKSEKEIIHLVFHALIPGPFNGYVHVKSDRENMVLPVELQVLKGGLHPTPKTFDFGILTSPEERRVVSVSLLNSGSSPVELLDAIPSMHDPSLSIEFTKGLVIPAGISAESVVHLYYSGASPGPTQGKVILTTNHSNAGLASVEVFFTASVLHGGVGYERNHVSFVVPLSPSSISLSSSQILSNKNEEEEIRYLVRSVPFTNYFTIPLVLNSVSVSSCGLNESLIVAGSVGSVGENIALPQETWDDVSLKFDVHGAAMKLDLPHTCTLTLLTNVSTHHIPIHIYDGRLKVSLNEFAKNSSCVALPLKRESTDPAVLSDGVSSSSSMNLVTQIPNDRSPYVDENGTCFDPFFVNESSGKKTKKKSSNHRNSDDGKLQRGSGGVVMEFGKLGNLKQRRRRINVTNLNPVPVNVSATMTKLFKIVPPLTSSSSSSSSSPSSKFYYLGQYLSPFASPPLVEVYEDMLGQGAIPNESNEFNVHNLFDDGVNDNIMMNSYDVPSSSLYFMNKHVFSKSGKFSILPGHTAVFEIEIKSGVYNQSVSSSKTSKKQKKDSRKNQSKSASSSIIPGQKVKGLVMTMETPVETIPYYINLEVISGDIISSKSSIEMITQKRHETILIYNYRMNMGIAAIQLSSTFLEPVLICDLFSSQPNWIDITMLPSTFTSTYSSSSLITPEMIQSLNLIHKAQECVDISKISRLPPPPTSTTASVTKQSKTTTPSSTTTTNKKVSPRPDPEFVDVGVASIIPKLICDDFWACIGKWAYQITYPYVSLNELNKREDHFEFDIHSMDSFYLLEQQKKMNQKIYGQNDKNDDYDIDYDYDYLEEEEKRMKFQQDSIHDMFASFDVFDRDDVRASRMVAQDLSSTILSNPPYDLSGYIDRLLKDEALMKKMKSDEDVNPITSKEHDDLTSLQEHWETFKTFGLNRIKADIGAITSVGTMPKLLEVFSAFEAPKIHVEKTGFGVTQVGDVASEYFTVYNHDTKPLALQLTALMDDPAVAFANNKYNRHNYRNNRQEGGGRSSNTNPSSSMSGNQGSGSMNSNDDALKKSTHGGSHESAEWWNMRLKTVNNGIGTTAAQRMKTWRNNNKQQHGQGSQSVPHLSSSNSLSSSKQDLNNIVSGRHLMNLLSASSGEVVSTCPLIDGMCLPSSNDVNDVPTHPQQTSSRDAKHASRKHGKNITRFATWEIDPTSLPAGQSLFEIAQRAVSTQSIIQPFYLPINATRPIIVPPGEKIYIGPIFFRPPTLGSFQATLYLRNNVSRIQTIDLEGKAGQGKAIVRTKGSIVHHVDEIFTLKFMLNTSFWQPYNKSHTMNHQRPPPSQPNSWFSSLVSNNQDELSTKLKASKHKNQESYMNDDDDDSLNENSPINMLKGSLEYFEPPIWPNPAIHIVRIENHGNLPIHITDLIVGSKVEPISLMIPFGKLFTNEKRINPCVGLNSGFVVHGCEQLGVTLGPLQAWNILVSYYGDCSTINDVDTLHISTSVGNFDIILQAISKKSDMSLCSTYDMRANYSISLLLIRLAVLFISTMFLMYFFNYVKSHYKYLNQTERTVDEILSSSSSITTSNTSSIVPSDAKTDMKTMIEKKRKDKKSNLTATQTKNNVNTNPRKQRKWEKELSSVDLPSDSNMLFSQMGQMLELEKSGGWIDSTPTKSSGKRDKHDGAGSKHSSKTNDASSSSSSSHKNNKKVSSSSTPSTTTMKGTVAKNSNVKEVDKDEQESEDSPVMEFLVQVESEEEKNPKSILPTSGNKKVVPPVSSSSSSPLKPLSVDVIEKTSIKTDSNSNGGGGGSSSVLPSQVVAAMMSTSKDPLPTRDLGGVNKVSTPPNKVKNTLKVSPSLPRPSTLVPSVSALLSSTEVSTPATTNTTAPPPINAAKARREKKKQEDRERKEKMEAMDKAKKLKEASDKAKKEAQASDKAKKEAQKEAQAIKRSEMSSSDKVKDKVSTSLKNSSSSSRSKEPEVIATIPTSTSKKKVRDASSSSSQTHGEVSSKSTKAPVPSKSNSSSSSSSTSNKNKTSSAVRAQPPPPLPPQSVLSSANANMMAATDLGIGAGWAQVEDKVLPNATPKGSLSSPDCTHSTHGVDGMNTGSANINDINMPPSLFGGVNDVSPVLGSSLPLMMNGLGSSPLRHSNLENNMPSLNLEPSGLSDFNIGRGADTTSSSSSSSSLFGSSSSFGSNSYVPGRSLFPELSSQDTDMNVDSLFGDIGSSIAASLDLDISDDDPPDLRSSRLVGMTGRDADTNVVPPMMDGIPEDSDIKPFHRSRLSHYIKGDSFTEKDDGDLSFDPPSSLEGDNGTSDITQSQVPDYHRDVVELDFFVQDRFFGLGAGGLEDDGIEDEENYLQGGGDEDEWE